MIRLCLRLIGISTAIFAVVIVAVRAQPYDDGGLRAGLFSPDCAPPCFMGIHPGVTTRDEVLELLQSHPWVARVAPIFNNQGLTWTWNGKQPAFLRSGRFENHVLIENGIVYRIDLLTWADMATFTLLLGTPDALYDAGWREHDDATNTLVNIYQENALYAGHQLEVQFAAFCPLSIYQQWSMPTAISMPALSNHAGYRVVDHAITPLGEDCR